MLQYLQQEKGIDPARISNVTGRFAKLPTFSVEVIFEDEPEVRYFYREWDGSIIQYSHHSKSRKSHYRYAE